MEKVFMVVTGKIEHRTQLQELMKELGVTFIGVDHEDALTAAIDNKNDTTLVSFEVPEILTELGEDQVKELVTPTRFKDGLLHQVWTQFFQSYFKFEETPYLAARKADQALAEWVLRSPTKDYMEFFGYESGEWLCAVCGNKQEYSNPPAPVCNGTSLTKAHDSFVMIPHIKDDKT